MRLINTIKELFYYKEADRLIINDEIHQNNLVRIFYLGITGTPVIFTLVLFYYIALHDGSSIEYKWRSAIILIHSMLFIVLVIGSLLAYKLKKEKASGLVSKIFIDFVFFIITIAGVATAVMDQLVTPSIVPYMLSCTITALVVLVRPAVAFLYFFISYIIIYLELPLFQTNEAVILSNRLDALVSVAVGFILSVIQWKNSMVRYRQSKLIDSQKKELESSYHKLVKYAEELNVANAAKAKFFSIIANDLRGPINSTISASEILLDAEDYTPEERTHLVKLLNAKLKNTYKLLENLLTWSKGQANQITYNPTYIKLYGLIAENIEALKTAAQEKSISIINTVSTDFIVIGDKEMSNIVFRNLISNAIKFTNENGKVEIDAMIYGNTGKYKKYLEITIKDSGVGMTDEVKNSLFQIDKKVFNVGTKNETGSGLGLILCKDFIERQGGNIWITSEVDKGACFTFTLPLSIKTFAMQQ